MISHNERNAKNIFSPCENFMFFDFTYCKNSHNVIILLKEGGNNMFAQRLKELRKRQGITQIEFAKIFNISNGTIGNWESGNRMPDFNTIQKIADYFNVTVDYLLGRESESQQKPEIETDIEKILENTFDNLENTDGLMFDGVPATQEDIEQIKAAMRIGMSLAKEKSKEKFTPKKHKK